MLVWFKHVSINSNASSDTKIIFGWVSLSKCTVSRSDKEGSKVALIAPKYCAANIVIESVYGSHDSNEVFCNVHKPLFGPSRMMVSLRVKHQEPEDIPIYVHICAGVLLNPKHILAVKNCMHYGEFCNERPNYAIEMKKIDSFAELHMDSDIAVEYTKDMNEIIEWRLSETELMVLKVKSPFADNINIKYAELPKPGSSGYIHFVCPKVIRLGWLPEDNFPIQCGEIAVKDIDTCEKIFDKQIKNGSIVFNRADMICASDAIVADLGGPILCGQNYDIYGVVVAQLKNSVLISRIDNNLDSIEKMLAGNKQSEKAHGNCIHFSELLFLLPTFVYIPMKFI